MHRSCDPWRLGAALAALLLTARPATAQVTLVTDRGSIAGFEVDWLEALGPTGSPVPPSFDVFLGAMRVTVHNEAGTPMERRDQLPCDFWEGNFPDCEPLLWTQSPGTGPLHFEFSQPVSAFGVGIEPDFQGFFLAFIQVSYAGTPIGAVEVSGDEDAAVFIGIHSATPFDVATVGLRTAPADPADFAIDGPVFGHVVPEPSSLALLATGLLLLGAARARRRSSR